MSKDISPPLTDDLSELKERVAIIENELAAIHNRNRRVESSKNWETSRMRILSVTGITYVTMILVFVVLGSRRPFLDAVVPTTGFFLSTLSLSFLRALLEKRASQ